jgi:hypothetical protein
MTVTYSPDRDATQEAAILDQTNHKIDPTPVDSFQAAPHQAEQDVDADTSLHCRLARAAAAEPMSLSTVAPPVRPPPAAPRRPAPPAPTLSPPQTPPARQGGGAALPGAAPSHDPGLLRVALFIRACRRAAAPPRPSGAGQNSVERPLLSQLAHLAAQTGKVLENDDSSQRSYTAQ